MISQAYYIKLFGAVASLKCVLSHQEVSESPRGQLIPTSPKCAAPGVWSSGLLRNEGMGIRLGDSIPSIFHGDGPEAPGHHFSPMAFWSL